MKKIISLLLVSVMVFTLVACGGSGGSSEEYTAEKPLVFRFAYVNATEDPAHIAAEKFKEVVEEKSEGKIKVELYPNGELGSDVAVLESVAMNDIQMTAPASSSLATYDERLALVDLPLLFENYDAMNKIVDTELKDLYDSWLNESGFKLLGLQFDGTRCISNSKRPINSADDLKGMKIGAMESDIHINTFKALGASPIPMPYNDVYTGLQQGTIDGQDNPPSLTVAGKFNEVQKFYSLTNLVIALCPVVVNNEIFAAYPEDIQKIIMEAAGEHLIKWQRDENYKEEQNYIKVIKDGGTAVNEVSDMDSLKDKIEPVYDAAKKKCGEESVNQLLEICK